ncbi:MAG: hypothetical protein AABY11_03250, partial [archaeon]
MKHYILFLFAVLALAATVHAQVPTVTSYNVEPSPVIPGSTFTLYAYVLNNTSLPIDDAIFTLQLGEDSFDTSFPFSIEPTDSLVRSLGVIPPFATIQVKYQIRVDPSALDGSYTLRLFTSSGSSAGDVLDVPIQIFSRKPVLSIISATPSEVSVGATTTLSLMLKNTGTSPATNLLISIKEDRTVTAGGAVVERDIVPLGASAQYLANLGPGDTATIMMPILVNPSATSKPYFVPITIDFYDENQTQ